MRNSIKNFFLIIFASILSMGIYQYYQNYNQARAFNNFLDSAALVSSLHVEASEEFRNVLSMYINRYRPVFPLKKILVTTILMRLPNYFYHILRKMATAALNMMEMNVVGLLMYRK